MFHILQTGKKVTQHSYSMDIVIAKDKVKIMHCNRFSHHVLQVEKIKSKSEVLMEVVFSLTPWRKLAIQELQAIWNSSFSRYVYLIIIFYQMQVLYIINEIFPNWHNSLCPYQVKINKVWKRATDMEPCLTLITQPHLQTLNLCLVWCHEIETLNFMSHNFHLVFFFA